MPKTVRSAIALVLLCALILVPGAAFAAKDINVTVDGQAIAWTDAKPFADANNRTLVPLRAVGEALGLNVSWNGKEAVFTEVVSVPEAGGGIYTEEREIRFALNDNYARTYYRGSIDGQLIEDYEMEVIEMDTSAVSKGGRTYAPARYLAEFFGYSVGWDSASSTVIIDSAAAMPNYDFADWSVLAANKEYAIVQLLPGADFKMLATINVTKVYCNDTPIKFEEYTKLEMIPEGMTADQCFAFKAYGDFTNPNNILNFDTIATSADGYEYFANYAFPTLADELPAGK